MCPVARRGVLGRAAFVALLFPLLLTACPFLPPDLTASGGQPNELQRKVQHLEQAVAELQRGTTPAKDADPDVVRRLDRLGKEVGDLRARLDAMEEQWRKLSDLDHRADQALKAASQAQKEAARVDDDLKMQLSNLAKKVRELESRIQARATEPPAQAAGSAERPTTAAPPEKKPLAQGLYEEGYALYKERKYDAAREKFREYARLYPDTPYTDNAYFWIGETYFEQAQANKDTALYEKAILEYDKVVQQFPKGDKIASALLKQALAFDALGDPTDARILLKKLLRDHPSSDQATFAKKKLEALGD